MESEQNVVWRKGDSYLHSLKLHSTKPCHFIEHIYFHIANLWGKVCKWHRLRHVHLTIHLNWLVPHCFLPHYWRLKCYWIMSNDQCLQADLLGFIATGINKENTNRFKKHLLSPWPLCCCRWRSRWTYPGRAPGRPRGRLQKKPPDTLL